MAGTTAVDRVTPTRAVWVMGFLTMAGAAAALVVSDQRGGPGIGAIGVATIGGWLALVTSGWAWDWYRLHPTTLVGRLLYGWTLLLPAVLGASVLRGPRPRLPMVAISTVVIALAMWELLLVAMRIWVAMRSETSTDLL